MRRLRTFHNPGWLLTVLCALLTTHITFSQEIKNCPDPLPNLIGKGVSVFNMGEVINSEFAEYNAVFNSEGSFMIFTTRNDSSTGEDIYGYDGQYYEDIMISEKKGRTFTQGTNAADRPDLFPIQINTEKHEAPVFLSENDSLFIIYKHDKLWHAELTDTGYTTEEIYGENINISTYQRHASVTADGNTMYFSSEVLDKKTGRLHHDIFVSHRGPNDTWMPAKALGTTINTLYDEDSPEISPDGSTMFFASQKPGGLGGYDIYYSTLEDSTWTAPINLCAPINSPAHDIYFKLSKFGPYAYFSSNRLGGFGNMDIYKVLLNYPRFVDCRPMTKGFKVDLDVSQNIDPRSAPLKYFWDMGDGTIVNGTKASHYYKTSGTYVIKLGSIDLTTGKRYTTDYVDTITVELSSGQMHLEVQDTVEVGKSVRVDASKSRLDGKLIQNHFWRMSDVVVAGDATVEWVFPEVGVHYLDLYVNRVNEDSIDMEYACVSKKIVAVSSEDYAAYAERNNIGTSAADLLSDDELLIEQAKAEGNELALVNDAVNTLINTPVAIYVFENDADEATRRTLNLVSTTKASHGEVSVNQNDRGVVWYMPNNDYVGSDRFQYIASSMDDKRSAAQVLIRVLTEEDYLSGYPVRNDQDTVGRNEAVVIDVFKNDPLVDEEGYRIHQVSKARNGKVEIIDAEKGIVKYTPNTGFEGADAFTYQVRNAQGVQNTAHVRIQVGEGTAVELLPQIKQAEAGDAVLFDLFINEHLEIAKGRKLTSIIGPDGGNVRIMDAEKGQVMYLPNNNFRGLDGFTYYFEDEYGVTSAGGVSVVVGGEADESQLDAKPDQFVTAGGNAITFTVLDNDFALNNGKMNVVDITQPANGEVEIVNAGTGEVRYVPNKGFVGEEVLTYTIADENGLRSKSNVTITVQGDATSTAGILLAKDERETSMNEPLVLYPLENDRHMKGRKMEIISVGQPQHGHAEITNKYTGEVMYIPGDGFSGEDRFVYEVIDSRGMRAKAEVVVQVISPLSATSIDLSNVPNLSLESIYFDYDDDQIRPSEIPALERNLAKLKENPQVLIKVSSHCDARGSRAYNVNLSSRRATNTLNYLVEHGLSKNRLISVVGMGELELVNDCGDGVDCPDEDHQLNRRSEFIVVGVLKQKQ